MQPLDRPRYFQTQPRAHPLQQSPGPSLTAQHTATAHRPVRFLAPFMPRAGGSYRVYRAPCQGLGVINQLPPRPAASVATLILFLSRNEGTMKSMGASCTNHNAGVQVESLIVATFWLGCYYWWSHCSGHLMLLSCLVHYC